MSLKDRISEDEKAAMRARDSERLSTLRMLKAGMKQREVDERITLEDAHIIAIIEKMVKTRKESVEQFARGGREDLVAKESKEIELLQAYLPAQLSETELDALISAAIAESGATSIKDMGKVMKTALARLAGKSADGARVSQMVKEKLS